ncbi:MAG: hypothetical protein ACRDF0_01830 [Candidatus Limnocylindria bacterium]
MGLLRIRRIRFPLLAAAALAAVACAPPQSATSSPSASLGPTKTVRASATSTPYPTNTPASVETMPTAPTVAVDIPTGLSGDLSAFGDLVTWGAYPRLPERGSGLIPNTLFMHRISTRETTRLATSIFPEQGQIGQVRTDGRWVVWTDLQYFRPVSGEWRIFAEDVASGERFEAARNTTAGDVLARLNFTWPTLELHEGRIVWNEAYATEDGLRANRIHVMDLDSRQARVVRDSDEDGLVHPTVYGDRVAFVRVEGVLTERTNMARVTVVDLRTDVESEPAPEHPGYQPSIWKDHLVWKSFPLHEAGDVFLYSFADETVVRISAHADFPTVGERGVTWNVPNRSTSAVPFYEIATGKHFVVEIGRVGKARVQGPYLVWNHIITPTPDQADDPPYKAEIRVRVYR